MDQSNIEADLDYLKDNRPARFESESNFFMERNHPFEKNHEAIKEDDNFLVLNSRF